MSLKDNLINRSLRMRRMALTSIFEAKSGHPGGVLSAIDLVNFILCENLKKEKNSRFILSKGHAAPALYTAAAENGWIKPHILSQLRKLGSPLQGHPSVVETPWAETSTGSLGQGFSVAIGMSMGFRHQNNFSRVCVMLGDGELQEGEVWEGVMCAAHYKLNNLCAIIDYNKLQSDDLNENIIALEPLGKKWESFNWNVIEIDGHDFDQIEAALTEAKKTTDKPSVVIANTIKGKGVSFMEGVPAWHGSVKLLPEELEKALLELEVSSEDIPSYIDGSIWSKL
ncbi:transketolase [Pelagibacterales bacterium]|nr:transketolase [Pelagibacterales bacterium]